MPTQAKHPCRQAGCRELLTRAGYCQQHQRESHSRYHAGSQSHQINNRFYASAQWRSTRKAHLAIEPLCRRCKAKGKLVIAEIVDHIIERSDGGPDFDEANLQSLCKTCHAAKSAKARAAR